jgi:hypothetical protein
VQVKINKIIRLIDHGQKCIASGKHSAINDAGHYYGRLAHPTLAFHAHNIFQQSHGIPIHTKVVMIRDIVKA